MFGVLPVTSLAVFIGLTAALALLDLAAGAIHARRSVGVRAPVRPRRDLDLRDVRPATAAVADRPHPLAEPVLESLREAYALGDWHESRRVTSPGARPSFSVRTDRGDYIVEVSHARTSAAAVAFEIRLLDHLADRAYPAPRVVPTQAGVPWHHDGGLYVVTERLSGTPYDPANPAHLGEAARALAAYHEAVDSFPERLRAEGRPVLAGLEKNGPAALAAFADIVGPFLSCDDQARLSRSSSSLWHQYIRVPEALSAVVAACPRLVVHGSFGPEVLHYQGDQLSGVEGYGRASYDLRVLDLADAVCGFAAAGGRFDLARGRGFLEAYDEANPLVTVELDALPLMVRFRSLVNVFTTITAFIDSPLLLLAGDGGAFGHLVDLAETEADRLRWLDEYEAEVEESLGNSRVG